MKPWYREPWPWILMAGPFAVVVAGAATMWVAFASADGLVADDYYKQGLAINKRIAKEREAERRGISAEVRLEHERLRVELKGDAPPALFVQLVHATRAGYDQRLRLAPVAAGVYESEISDLPRGHWHVVIEDPRGAWRIAKEAG